MSIIAFVGDVYTHGKVQVNYTWPEMVIFNLEYAVSSDIGDPPPNKVNLFSPFADFNDLFRETELIASLANNHITDCGAIGFRNTLNELRKRNIPYVGAGTRETNFNNPLIIRREDSTIGVLSYSQFVYSSDGYSAAPIKKERIIQDIELAKTQGADTVVGIVHWGVEEDPINNTYQTEIAHLLIDNGVDLVIGHHPHCIQPYSIYKGKYIFYSLGNFYFEDINVLSFYDAQRNPKRVYRKRQSSHNRIAWVVLYDTNKKTVIDVHELRNNKKKIIFKQCIDFSTKCKYKKNNIILKQLRKYINFIYSNSFTDGKLFDFKAIKHEMYMKRNRNIY